MPQVVNTNIASLNAQRNLNRSQASLAVALQRISSGLRVNSAKDDAAGLAISNRLTTQIRGLNQAARNAADAVSLAQTGEGALAELTNNLQRMREIAVQSRNATNTVADRESLDQEFQQLLSENDRIAKITTFNGRNILDGSLGTAVFQVGANVGETIGFDVSSSMRSNQIGLVATTDLTFQAATQTDTAATLAALTFDTVSAADGEIQINATDIINVDNSQPTLGLGDGSAKSIADAIEALSGVTGVNASANETTATITNANFAGALSFTDVGTADTLVYTLQINGRTITTFDETSIPITSHSDLITAINAESQTTGVVATLQANNDILLTAQDGRNIEFGEQLSASTGADADTVTGFFGQTIDASGAATAAQSNTFKATISLSSSANIQVTDTAVSATQFFAGIADNSTQQFDAAAIATANVLTTGEADNAIRRIDQALTDVDALRGTFGALQARSESTIRSLQTAAENASAANSRILDADFAAETAALTRAQILQQAGVAILAQANALPQNALALLQ